MKNHHHNGPLRPNSRKQIHEAIAERAYTLWVKAGRPDDQADAHWLEAERELVKSRQDSPSERSSSVDS